MRMKNIFLFFRTEGATFTKSVSIIGVREIIYNQV